MDALELGRQMLEYCRKFKIPQDYVMDILNDQKVVPMIRGKATEYAVEILLKDTLNAREWVVAKLNLNAQSGTHDEDVTVTHQRTGIIIKVECKNAVRGSFKYSTRARIKEPFCTVKCHRSRSDLSKASTTNDRYLVGDFDFVVCNLSNAIIAGATYSENFELIPDTRTVGRLCEYYGCDATYEALFEATYATGALPGRRTLPLTASFPERRPSGWKTTPFGAPFPRLSRPCWTSRERIGRE